MAIKILYIEDNMLNMQLVKKMLRPMGYDLLEAFDGRSGIAMASDRQPDVILMDIDLPDINGLEVTMMLKATEQLKNIPVVALTADSSAHSRCLEVGCDGYLNKPISKAGLLKVIQQFCQPTQTYQ
ncbi:MAG: response regulator [Chitinophagaceae bacterium]|nr:response regulator [Anaerolineae bacterium]